MKKIITLVSIALAATLLSSCVVAVPDEVPEIYVEKTSKGKTKSVTIKTPSEYKITCKNSTNYVITDWCVKLNNTETIARSDKNCTIPVNGSSTIYKLPEGRYQIFFTFDNCKQLQPENYMSSGSFELKSDVTYVLKSSTESVDEVIYDRSAVADGSAPAFVLEGSDGSVIDLVKTEE